MQEHYRSFVIITTTSLSNIIQRKKYNVLHCDIKKQQVHWYECYSWFVFRQTLC
jgi:hypothetical protein